MSAVGLSFLQALSSQMSSGASLDTHYYQSLKKGGMTLFADQQSMANENTMRLVSLMLQMPDQPFEWTLLGQ